jgi:GNAT superfamily N-acetyltransferase
MYSVRLATEDDIEVLLEMGRSFWETTVYPQVAEWNEDASVAWLFSIIDDGFILLAEGVDNKPLGMIAMREVAFPLNPECSGLVEHLWWVEPEARSGRIAKVLLDGAEEMAKEYEVDFIQMISLTTSSPGVENYYLKNGYVEQERSYMKRVEKETV